MFTAKQQENHEIRGRLELSDVFLPFSVYSLSHHFQETLHQARLHQLQLYRIWQQDEIFREEHSEQEHAGAAAAVSYRSAALKVIQ